jgi:hypothetical protein
MALHLALQSQRRQQIDRHRSRGLLLRRLLELLLLRQGRMLTRQAEPLLPTLAACHLGLENPLIRHLPMEA